MYVLYLLFINVCFCVSWFMIDWPQKEGLFFSGLWLCLHTLKSQNQVQKGVALVVRAEEQQRFSEDIIFPIFLFCSSQIYTIVHIYFCVALYMWQWLWMHLTVCRDLTCRYQGCAGTCFQYPFWVSKCGNLNYFPQNLPSGRRLFGPQKDIN